jgi:hypothetical protein
VIDHPVTGERLDRPEKDVRDRERVELAQGHSDERPTGTDDATGGGDPPEDDEIVPL